MSDIQQIPDLMTVAEAAKALRLNPRTVERGVREGSSSGKGRSPLANPVGRPGGLSSWGTKHCAPSWTSRHNGANRGSAAPH